MITRANLNSTSRVPNSNSWNYDALGRTLAMLSVTIDDMEAGRREIREGRTVSAEEVRRELRVHAR